MSARVDPVAVGSWSTQQLSEFLVVVAASTDEASAMACAIQSASEALEAEVAAIVTRDAVLDALGYPRGRVPVAELVRAAGAAGERLHMPGIGALHVIAEPIEHVDGSLVLGRSGDEGFNAEEMGLLRAMARTLSMTLRTLRTLDQERTLREEGERRAAENLQLLDMLQERQALLERLAKIQASISRRAPLPDVLGAIVAGAHELLGDEVVGLRLIDREDPAQLRLVSSIGVPRELQLEGRLTPVSRGIGGQAVREDCLVIADDYAHDDNSLPSFASSGLKSAMAAPIHENGVAVGSIVVATHKPRRQYTEGEGEVLQSFAHHASMALNDAKAVDQMRHLAYHDALTALPNRALFLEHLNRALMNARRSGQSLAVLFLDLDRFKLVNDSLGHPIGDQLLEAVGRRLRESLRSADLAARFGGDEFAVLAEATDASGANTLAAAIAETLRDPFEISGHELAVTASIGVVVDAGGSASAHMLLRNADLAMYRAKLLGLGRHLLFDPAMHAVVSDRVQLESNLRRAVQVDEFAVHYQPVIWLPTGDIVGAEALARWRGADGTLVPPAHFIPVAEEMGLVADIGRLVMRRAMRQAKAWQQLVGADRPFDLSVNLSPRQLYQPEVIADVKDALDEAGFDPTRLTLEITETALTHETELVSQRLRELSALGVRIALDDFGTGYSSLSHLRNFPIDVLKIDKSFIDDITVDTPDTNVGRAIIELARSLHLETVAEGVETAAQAEQLLRLRCTMAQGYHFFRPLAARDLSRILRQRVQTPALEVVRSDAIAG